MSSRTDPDDDVVDVVGVVDVVDVVVVVVVGARRSQKRCRCRAGGVRDLAV